MSRWQALMHALAQRARREDISRVQVAVIGPGVVALQIDEDDLDMSPEEADELARNLAAAAALARKSDAEIRAAASLVASAARRKH